MIIKESLARDIGRLFVWFPLRWLCTALPWPLSISLFKAMGQLQASISSHKYQQVRQVMLQHLGGISSLNAVEEARAYFETHLINTLFPFIIPQLEREPQNAHCDVRGWHHFEEAYAQGKGVILLQGHLGPVQFPLLYLARKKIKTGQVFYRQEHGLSFIGRRVQLHYRERCEARLKVTLFPVKAYQRPLFRWLKAGNVLVMNGDGIGGLEFVGSHYTVPFLGTMMKVPLGPYKLSLSTEAPLIPLYVSLSNNRFHIQFDAPLKSTKQEKKQKIHSLARQFASVLESRITAAPHTWHFWDGFQSGKLIPSA